MCMFFPALSIKRNFFYTCSTVNELLILMELKHWETNTNFFVALVLQVFANAGFCSKLSVCYILVRVHEQQQ